MENPGRTAMFLGGIVPDSELDKVAVLSPAARQRARESVKPPFHIGDVKDPYLAKQRAENKMKLLELKRKRDADIAAAKY